MGTRRTTPEVSVIPIPAPIRAGTGLGRIDYCDAHAVPVTAQDVTAEQWIRTMLEQSTGFWRRSLPPGWRLLGLRHGPRGSAQHVLGWPIVENTDRRIVLASPSRTGMPAELVLVRDGDRWVFVTLVRFDNRAMSGLWRAIGDAHRRIVRHLLRSAASRPARLTG